MDLGHPLVHLARRIDWELLDGRFASVCAAGAHKAGALATGDLEHVEVDTNVQPKAIAHPTDARLCHRALEKLVDLAKHYDVPLRQRGRNHLKGRDGIASMSYLPSPRGGRVRLTPSFVKNV